MSKRARSDAAEDNIENEPPFPKIAIRDEDAARRKERERQAELRQLEAEGPRPAVDPVKEMKNLAMTRGGGTYIPPHRLKAMMLEEQAKDAASTEFQRLTWEALRKSINGLINKVNVANIKYIIPDLFGENLLRGRGLFCRSIMRAQASSLPYTPVFACMVNIVNSKFPSVGELLIHRLVVQFRRAYKRNDKPTCTATLTFISQLTNQRVVDDVLIMEVLSLLLDSPTDDSVELAVTIARQVGLLLAESAPKFNNILYEMFRDVLHSSTIDKRVQFMVEVLFQIRKDNFKDDPIIPEGLDLVEEDDLTVHKISLTDQLNVQEGLNIFKFDPEYEKHESQYQEMKAEILGGDTSSEEGSAAEEDEDEDSDGEKQGEDLTGTVAIHDHTETNLVNLRRQIYLTIMSALDYQEAVHKLLKIELMPGQEMEMCNMIVECCSQERSYSKFYGSMGERLAKLNVVWAESFESAFKTYYETIHRYEASRLRNIARFFGTLLGTDAIPWTVFQVIKLTEDDTSSSSRIFIKILFQELVGFMGVPTMKTRFSDNSMLMYYSGMFPMDDPKNTRFAINFWTSIEMGPLTIEMREQLKTMPARIMSQQRALAEQEADESISSSSSDITTSSDEDTSDSEVDRPPRTSREARYRDESPPAKRRKYSRSPSPKRDFRHPDRRNQIPRSPPPRSRRPRSRSRSRSRSPRDESPPRRLSRTNGDDAPRSKGRAKAADFYDHEEDEDSSRRRRRYSSEDDRHDRRDSRRD